MDQEILNLKVEGKSLREIGKALGISHEAVRKRLKKLSTGNDELSTSRTPSHTIDEGVNPLDSLPQAACAGPKKVSKGVISGNGNLIGKIKEFLEERGIEIYRMRVGSEAYQIEKNGQIIRFYVQRSLKGDVTNDKKEDEKEKE